MDPLLNAFLLVFAGEMGDKTQLLSLMLVARYKQPWTILAGVTLATLLNHGLSAWLGAFVSSFVAPETLRWVLALIFFGFAIWILIPDKEESLRSASRFGVFLTTVVAFFLAEMGDKTQLATIALAASYPNVLLVTLATTLGMMASNGLALFFGDRLLKKVPMTWVRRFASALFVAFGIGILLKMS